VGAEGHRWDGMDATRESVPAQPRGYEMGSLRRFTPSPSMIVASVALMVALGGTSVARSPGTRSRQRRSRTPHCWRRTSRRASSRPARREPRGHRVHRDPPGKQVPRLQRCGRSSTARPRRSARTSRSFAVPASSAPRRRRTTSLANIAFSSPRTSAPAHTSRRSGRWATAVRGPASPPRRARPSAAVRRRYSCRPSTKPVPKWTASSISPSSVESAHPDGCTSGTAPRHPVRRTATREGGVISVAATLAGRAARAW
jgi:hypothetical protein